MMQKKSKKFITIIISLALIVAFALPAFATSGLWNVNLPWMSQTVDIVTGIRESSSPSSAWVDLDSMGGGYTSMNFVVRSYYNGGWHDVTNWNQLYSNGVAQREFPFTTTIPAGFSMMLAGNNKAWTTVTVGAHGQYDFH
jgi:hypothetical protein